ncbi:MAG: universal stress protein, partial [Cyanobacteria bacterium J06649_4]
QKWGQDVNPGDSSTSALSKSVTQRVLVTVANPETEDRLLELALILTKAGEGTLLPLNVLSDHRGKISAEVRRKQTKLLAAAEDVAHAATVAVEPISRVDDAIDKGILRTAVDQDASLIICGWKGFTTYKDNFFGTVLDNVARRSHVPLLIARFTHPVASTQRILLAVDKQQALSPNFTPTLEMSQAIATELKAALQVLVVVGVRQRQLTGEEVECISPDFPIEQAKGKLINRISKRIQPDDLIILEVNTHKRRLSTRQTALGIVPESITRSHPSTSVLVMHYPPADRKR